MRKKFEDNKGLIRSRKSKKDRKYNNNKKKKDKKEKQCSANH
jgi:hypothetical protein